MNDSRQLKRRFFNALLERDKAKARRLLNLIRLGEMELPLFVHYWHEPGKIKLDVNNIILTETDFQYLKKDVKQTIFWFDISKVVKNRKHGK